MSPQEFKLETRFTDKSNTRWLAAALAGVLLFGVGLTIWTSFPEWVLPMDDHNLAALIPEAPDGEPLGLKTVDQKLTEHTLRVFGTVENRTNVDIRNLRAVVQMTTSSGHLTDPVEVATEPPDLMPHHTAAFDATVELGELNGTYKVRFRLLDGPFLPHKDERPPAPAPKASR